MSTFAIVDAPPKTLLDLPSFNFSLVTCDLNQKAVSEITSSVAGLNKTFSTVLGAEGANPKGAKAITVNVIQATTGDLPKKLEKLGADVGGIGGMLLSGTAYEQISNTGEVRFNRILCNKTSFLMNKNLIQSSGKAIKVVDYDSLGSQIPQSMISHIAVMNNPLNSVPQIFPGNPVPVPWMPLVDTSAKEAFFGLCELVSAAYAAAGGGPAGVVAGIAALCKAGYNMYKNHMDDDDEYQDYFSQDMKNFLYKHLPTGGGSSKPWENGYGGSEMFSNLLKDMLLNHLVDLNDFVKFGLLNPANLVNDKYRVNLENYLGGREVNLRIEIGGIKK